MKLSESILHVLLSAQAKALATTGPAGLNVVPVSTVRIIEDEVYLVDCFFNKTRQNLQAENEVALTFWSGLIGYQLKAETEYLSFGGAFEKISKWAQQHYPERKVHGVIKLKPVEIFDISVTRL